MISSGPVSRLAEWPSCRISKANFNDWPAELPIQCRIFDFAQSENTETLILLWGVKRHALFDSYPQNTIGTCRFFFFLYDKQLHIVATPLPYVTCVTLTIMHLFTGMMCIYHCKCTPYRNSVLSKKLKCLRRNYNKNIAYLFYASTGRRMEVVETWRRVVSPRCYALFSLFA